MAVPGSPSSTPEEHRPHLPPLPPWERADSPLVQEPVEPVELRGAGSPRRNSLVIMESADEQSPVFESLDEDLVLQKVRSPLPFLPWWTASPGYSLRLMFSLQSHRMREPGPCAPSILFKVWGPMSKNHDLGPILAQFSPLHYMPTFYHWKPLCWKKKKRTAAETTSLMWLFTFSSLGPAVTGVRQTGPRVGILAKGLPTRMHCCCQMSAASLPLRAQSGEWRRIGIHLNHLFPT